MWYKGNSDKDPLHSRPQPRQKFGEQAIRHVAEPKRLIAEQRQRIEKLKASGISTLDAEQTVDELGHQRVLSCLN